MYAIIDNEYMKHCGNGTWNTGSIVTARLFIHLFEASEFPSLLHLTLKKEHDGGPVDVIVVYAVSAVSPVT